MYSWSKKLELGIEIIDEQHKQIFVETSKLLRALNSGDAKEQTYHAICFLEDYINKHFQAEEFYFEKLGFPEKENHIKLHRLFQQKITLIKNKHLKDGITPQSSQELGTFLYTWWGAHIEHVDTKYVELFRKSNLSSLH